MADLSTELPSHPGEATLDPKTPEEWEAMRAVGHKMVDDMIDFLMAQAAGSGPVWEDHKEEAETVFAETSPPTEPAPLEEVYDSFVNDILPYRMGNTHPRWMAWVIGGGTPVGMFADMLAAGMNSNCGGGVHSAIFVEQQVVAWLKTIFGFPTEASGVLTGGASDASLIAMMTAVSAKVPYDVQATGLVQTPGGEATIYCSAEGHMSVTRAVGLLGIGTANLRLVPLVPGEFRMDVAALQAMVTNDRAAGKNPICLVGGAGSVNTGAFDDLNALADLCETEGLWFHVDAAFGGAAILADDTRDLVAGIERADSITMDFHKWFSVPYDCGAVLVRDGAVHEKAFTLDAGYLHASQRGVSGHYAFTPWHHTTQLSRGNRALKVWMMIKAYGINKFGAVVSRNCAQARLLRDRLAGEDRIEVVAPVPLHIVCFRYLPASDDTLEFANATNEELMVLLQESGLAVVSNAKLDGKFVLRACISNHRTRNADIEVVVREVLRLGPIAEAKIGPE